MGVGAAGSGGKAGRLLEDNHDGGDHGHDHDGHDDYKHGGDCGHCCDGLIKILHNLRSRF